MFENMPGKTSNRILTVLSTLVLLSWVWRWFGPGSATVRASEKIAISKIGLSFMSLIWIAVSVVCGGYLLWRGMSYLFWHKYFKGESIPDEPKD
ncbi:MAG: hypothetical protein GXZ18_03715 [Synergistaceae bacterium]|nr:hypothetical protein [Synergistaceae bacterium]